MAKVYQDRFPIDYKGYGNLKTGYYMNEKLIANLDIMKKALTRDWDFFLVVDGPEGSGKSVLAMQIGMYMDANLKIENICFSPSEFTERVRKSKKYGCIIYDEAFGGLSSRRSMTMTNHVLVKMFTEIRQRNLSIILVLPSFFDMDKMPAIHRSRALVHVTAKNFKRGYFNFYSFNRKRSMYLLGKKTYSYVAKPNFSGRFTNFYVVDEDEYKKRKYESLKIQNELAEEEKAPTYRASEVAYFRITNDLNWSKKDYVRAARDLGMSDNALYIRMLEIKKELIARYNGDAKNISWNRIKRKRTPVVMNPSNNEELAGRKASSYNKKYQESKDLATESSQETIISPEFSKKNEENENENSTESPEVTEENPGESTDQQEI